MDRTLELLDLLSEKEEGYMITEIAEILDIPISSVHRLLTSLRKNGYILQDHQTKKYKLGLKILQLAINLLNHTDIRRVARPYMEKLSQKYDEVVFLTVIDEDTRRAICIDTVIPSTTYKFYVKLGSEMPVNAAVAAQAILAYMDEKLVDEIIQQKEHKQYTPHSLIDPKEIKEKIQKIGKTGYGICDEELEIGVKAIAAPVMNQYGQVVASIATVGMKVWEKNGEEKIKDIQEAAMDISYALGFQKSYRLVSK